jgi:hypothetical protein
MGKRPRQFGSCFLEIIGRDGNKCYTKILAKKKKKDSKVN